MSINNVGSISSFFIVGGSSITEETRRKLLSLGIDPSTVSSETEAKALINKIERQKSVQKVSNDSNSKNTCSSEQDYINKKQNENTIYEMLNMSANVNKIILGL